MGYVKLVGTQNPHESWNSGYVLERNEETGEITKEAQVGIPVDLTKEQQEKLEALGAVFESSSADEAKEIAAQVEETPQVGADVAAAAPLLGSGGSRPNQTAASPSGDKDNSK